MYFHSVTCGLSSLAALYAGLTAVEKKWKMWIKYYTLQINKYK